MFKWKLRACRVQAGLYQREAAKALGISEVSLVNYEKGKSKEMCQSPYRRFVIATDNDEAGRKAARRIKDKLIPLGFRFFNLKWLTDLKDVNELIQNYGDDFEDYLHRY